MNSRFSILLMTMAMGLSSGMLQAQEEGEAAPAVSEGGSVTETPVESGTVPPAGSNDAVIPEEPPTTRLLEKSGDVLVMPETSDAPAPPLSLPKHGMKMNEVERQYGSPISREPAVGTPPITRWNYDGFSVFFEHSTVLHAVQKDRPAEIYRKDELLPASTP